MRRLLVVLSLLCLPIAASAQSLTPTSEVVAFDSAGKYMGKVGSGSSLLFLLDDGRSVNVSIDWWRGDWTHSGFYYQTPDCTGQKFVWNSGFATPSGTDLDNVLYVTDGEVPVEQNFLSRWDPYQTLCSSWVATTTMPAVVPYVDLDTLYTPPFKLEGQAPLQPSFSDVPETHPYFRFIELIKAAGVTGGCGGGKFCPDSPLTRGQMAVFLAQAMGLRFEPAP